MRCLLFFLVVSVSLVPIKGAISKIQYNTPQGLEIEVGVGGLKDTEVSANVFKWQTGLRVDWTRTENGPTYAVASFSYARGSANEQLVVIDVVGTDFSEAVLQDLANAQAGNVVYLDKILVKESTGKLLKMPSIVYKLL